MFNKDITYSIPWNCFLIITGSIIGAIGLKSIAAPHNFVPGGMFGLAFLIHYVSGFQTPGIVYALINIPLFLIGKFYISTRFLLYSFLAMITYTIAYELIAVDFGIANQLYAAITCGVITGTGSGIVLRSVGSNGGLDIISVVMYQKFNIGLGKFFFIFNALIYSFSFFTMDIDLVIASIIMVFVTSVAMEYSLAVFNQRKMVLIISNEPRKITRQVIEKLKISSTYINGEGAYSGSRKKIIMTVINNIQLKRLEELVFTEDENALFIVENTFNVIGSTFSRRKIY